MVLDQYWLLLKNCHIKSVEATREVPCKFFIIIILVGIARIGIRHK